MYFSVKQRYDKLPSDPKARRAAVEAWEKADSLPLRQAYAERMKLMKHKRLAEYAERHDLVEQDIEAMRAIRKNMEHRIND